MVGIEKEGRIFSLSVFIDFVVGNYWGKSVVIFRTRPKLNIYHEFRFSKDNQTAATEGLVLQVNQTEFWIHYCLWISLSSQNTTLEEASNLSEYF